MLNTHIEGMDHPMNVRRIGFLFPSGQNDFVEVYGPAKQDTNLLPDSAVGPTVALIVDDVVGARAEVVATGLELLSEVIWAADGFGWFFLRAPAGNIYCIEQVPE